MRFLKKCTGTVHLMLVCFCTVGRNSYFIGNLIFFPLRPGAKTSFCQKVLLRSTKLDNCKGSAHYVLWPLRQLLLCVLLPQVPKGLNSTVIANLDFTTAIFRQIG